MIQLAEARSWRDRSRVLTGLKSGPIGTEAGSWRDRSRVLAGNWDIIRAKLVPLSGSWIRRKAAFV